MRIVQTLLLVGATIATGLGVQAQTAAPIPIPQASISAANLGVIVAQGDSLSESIAQYYVAARGIPPQNVVHVALSTASQQMTAAAFNPLKAMVDAALPANVQATLLTWAQPTQVVTAGVDGTPCSMSITSAFAFGTGSSGYGTAYCQNAFAGGGLSYSNYINSNSVAISPFFNSDSTTPWQDFGIRPSMMLGVTTLAAAQELINRGISSDATYPTGNGYLLETGDTARDIRQMDCQNGAFQLDLPTLGPVPNCVDYAKLNSFWLGGLNLSAVQEQALMNQPKVLFYFTGLPQVPDLTTNQYLPGAIGDNLTSYGGILPNNPADPQTTVSDWITAGVTGAYGTVEEPTSDEEKFAIPSLLIDRYFRGGTLLESYWKSIARPGEGLFVGEPLARPYEDQPSWKVVGNAVQFTTRALARNTRYVWDYQRNSQWYGLGTVVTPDAVPALRTWSVPLPPSSSTSRVLGPCQLGPDPFNASFGFPAPYNSAPPSIQVEAGRWQVAAYNLVLDFASNGQCNNAAGQLAISANVTTTSGGRVPGGPIAVQARLLSWPSPYFSGFNFTEFNPAGGYEYLAIDFHANVRPTVPAGTYLMTITLVDSYGERQTKQVPFNVVAPSAVGSIRIIDPQENWYVPIQPTLGLTPGQAAPFTSLTMEADVSPILNAAQVRFTLQDEFEWFPPVQVYATQGSGLWSNLWTVQYDMGQLGITAAQSAIDQDYSLLAEALDSNGKVIASRMLGEVAIYDIASYFQAAIADRY